MKTKRFCITVIFLVVFALCVAVIVFTDNDKEKIIADHYENASGEIIEFFGISNYGMGDVDEELLIDIFNPAKTSSAPPAPLHSADNEAIAEFFAGVFYQTFNCVNCRLLCEEDVIGDAVSFGSDNDRTYYAIHDERFKSLNSIRTHYGQYYTGGAIENIMSIISSNHYIEEHNGQLYGLDVGLPAPDGVGYLIIDSIEHKSDTCIVVQAKLELIEDILHVTAAGKEKIKNAVIGYREYEYELLSESGSWKFNNICSIKYR